MTLRIAWSHSYAQLADDLFDQLDGDRAATPATVFARRDCIVVPNRIQQAWLQLHYLFDRPRNQGPRVLANCDFPLLPLFVNDWLARMNAPGQAPQPDPENHPFSVKSMRWRLYEMLRDAPPEAELAPVQRYIQDRDGETVDPRKCFKLAGRLAALLEQYVTYRPAMMADWQRGGGTDTTAATAWEPILWRRLVHGAEDQTFLAAFQAMATHLPQCAIADTYGQIRVFAPVMMPVTYLAFFLALSQCLPVQFYLFNPSPTTDWFDRESLRARALPPASLTPPADDEGLAHLDRMHPLLSAYARGWRDLVAGALDLTDGQIEDQAAAPQGGSVLAALRQTIVACDATRDRLAVPPDDSIQLHLCHGKMREVEILRDQLLKCFADLPGLQPRQVQVQVADMTAYAPYIEAVFSTPHPAADATIPFVFADRIAAGESQVATAFRRLLSLGDSRFSAPEVVDLFRCESLGRAFGIEPGDVEEIALWLHRAGIRWGRTPDHRQAVCGAAFGAETTWRHGLDRLLLGYALGPLPPAHGAPPLIPCDCAEGQGAVLLGRLVACYERLTAFTDYCAQAHPVASWADRLEALIDDFFINDNQTFADLARLKGAVRLLRASSAAAGYRGAVPLPVIRDFLTGQLGETEGGTGLTRNAVCFSSLRPGSSTPRRVMCLLGMGDGLFPRAEHRPAYDLLRGARKLGDRSQPIEDRMAFLEALLNADERLLISYPAFSEEDNERACESVVVRELCEYLDLKFGPEHYRQFHHRLQAFHPDYFRPDSPLISYSISNWSAAARRLPRDTPPPPARPVPAPAPLMIELDDLVAFFKHPARFYYRRILGARLELDTETALEDAETFAPDPLARYAIREALLKALLDPERAADDWEPLHAQLCANGQIPLGDWGRAWFKKARDELSALLDTCWEDVGSLRDLLLAARQATGDVRTVTWQQDGVPITLSGLVPGFSLGPEGRQAVLAFRCGSARADHALAAWLSHLLLAAAGQPVESLIVQGKDSKDVKAACLTIPARTDAAALLREYVRIYRDGRERILPFTPEMALAYMESKSPGGDPPAAKERALEQAVKQWVSNGSQPAFQGVDDPYYRAAHGEEGPLQDAGFAALAEQIMGPLLAASRRLPKEKAQP
ncbi:MAG: exodeoxyribonuclease V subunit gamma [Candidatus Marinimicrobia bacterium]|nr:exodeoxyribonuclease V subunit gamma [Candidatus Neomarinimicrobiota bacterium]